MAKIVIIGGGVAGLSAGIRARESGHEAVIAERHTTAGGNLTGWDRNGYHVDNCIHWLTGTNPLTKLSKTWGSLGALDEGDVYYPDSLYTYEKDGRRLSLFRDLDRLAFEMTAASPRDADETARFIRAVRAAKALFGISGNYNDVNSRFFEKIRRSPFLVPYYFLTAGELAARFSDPLVSGFLSEFLTDGFGALGLIFVFAAFCGDNGGIPRGSSCGMAKRMENRFLELGGTLLTGTEAKRINVAGSRATSVTLKDGGRITGDFFIPACDPSAVFGKMIGEEHMPRSLRRMYSDPALFRFSSCHCAFACDRGAVPFRGDLLLDLPESERRGKRANAVVLREFSHEPDFAPDGKAIIQTMFFCDEAESAAIIALNEEKYEEKKREIADDMSIVILGRFPALARSLELLDVWTPATYGEYTAAGYGSYMGFAFSSRVIPSFAPGRLRGLDNVILATQWQRAPGGLPNAAAAGIAAVKTIDRLARRLRRRPVRDEPPRPAEVRIG